MKLIDWSWLKELTGLLATQRPEPVQQANRIVAMQLHIVLPARVGVIGTVLYYLFYAGGLNYVAISPQVVIETLQEYFPFYVGCNAVAVVAFLLWRRFPPGLIPWLVFVLGILDGLLVAGLASITGGFESTAYWVFPGLIVLNALSIPLAMPQIVLNVLLSLFYLSAGILHTNISTARPELPLIITPGRSLARAPVSLTQTNLTSPTNEPAGLTNSEHSSRPRRTFRGWRADAVADMPGDELATEPFLLRVFVLWLLTVCCYGVQVLAERQRRAMEEERDFAVREAQLRSASRVAAEFVHQIKNPLAIITNASFSMQRALREGRTDVAKQIEIIREEVERSDRIVTQIMGYAQLSEGRVEKLDLAEELDHAIEQVFPAAAGFGIQLERLYGDAYLPPLLMQRRHLSEIIVNLLQNAREAQNGAGKITVAATEREPDSIEITVADNGPGIPPEKLEKIFEAYYTTKEKGTGLGLAIVKHNVEVYGGVVRVESALGKGARFVLVLPGKAAVNLANLT